jgi:Glyoxalase/Bleomycin resistance protein/Dioxygenase superfamily
VTHGFGPIRQLGYLAVDLDAAIEAWMRDLAVGPWTKLVNIALPATYRGEPTTVGMEIALAYRGDLQIELIRQTDDAPSPYRDWIRRGRFGLHHVAHLSTAIEADVARATSAGLGVVFDIRMPAGGRYVYLQSPALGDDVFVELLEATPVMRDMFEGGMAAAAAWDGTPEVAVVDLARR